MKLAACKLLQNDLDSGKDENESTHSLTTTRSQVVPCRATPSAPVGSHVRARNTQNPKPKGKPHTEKSANTPDRASVLCANQAVQLATNKAKGTGSEEGGDKAAADFAERKLPTSMPPSVNETLKSAPQGTLRDNKLRALALELKSIRNMLNERTSPKEVVHANHANSIPEMINVPRKW